MASNSWNETIADVNKTLANMNTAISDANGAATSAGEAQENAEEQVGAALAATNAANNAAADANAEAAKWKNATASAKALDAGSQPTIEIAEQNGVKHFTFGVPRGEDGAKGEKGDMGKSGVTFRLSGSTLTITTG
jgi:hypothetical protein